MGLGFVLLIWAILGLILAGLGSLIFGGLTAFLTRGVPRGRKRAIIAAGVFPFVCLAWGGAVFVFQAVVNEGMLKRDLGIGDTSHCPLANGYQLMMIDVTDQGWVYNPATQGSSGIIRDKEDAIPGVRNLQVAGRYILGASDSNAFEHLGRETNAVDSYFLLDTQQGKRTQFHSEGELDVAARQLGIEVQLQPIYSVYSKYRFSWFDVFAGILFCVPPAIAGVLLLVWIARVRRTRGMAP